MSLRLLVGQFLGYSDAALKKTVKAGELIEVTSDEQAT
jgi:hypothetical protein